MQKRGKVNLLINSFGNSRYFTRIQYKRISMNFLVKTRAIARAMLNETSKLANRIFSSFPKKNYDKCWQTSLILIFFHLSLSLSHHISRAIIRKCNNALYPDLYGHYREAKFTQTKHHWYVKSYFNGVFSCFYLTSFVGLFYLLGGGRLIVYLIN